MMTMPPINLLNYAILRDSKPHSRETANRLPLRVEVKTTEIKRILASRNNGL
jgi:hypothetical protein